MLDYIQSLVLTVGPLSLILQLVLCIHVYRTGRPFWWIWLIMMGSLLGCLLYLFLEVLPDARRNNSRMIKGAWFVPRRVIIRRAQEQVALTDTVETRLSLASQLYEYGHKEEAEQVASECASGVFADDPVIVSEVAWYKVAIGKLAEAEQILAKVDAKNNKQARSRIDLLKARILLGNKRCQEAMDLLSSLPSVNLGEEPRYYMALCHLALGNVPEGVRMLTAITKSFRKGSKVWRRSEKAWYKAATLKIKEIRKQTPS